MTQVCASDGRLACGSLPYSYMYLHKHNCAFLAECSKALRSGRSFFGSVGSNPTGCIHLYFYIILIHIFIFKKDLFIQQLIVSQLDYLCTGCINISFYILYMVV